MKKINLLLILTLAFVLQSCLKDDKDTFDLSASDRMEQRIKENNQTLLSASNGWVMRYYPQQDRIYGGFSIFVKFGEENQVSVMTNVGGSEAKEESYYSLSSDNGPVLRFDTHNSLFHYFSEPKNPDGIGPADSGMQGDYEFMIIDATPEKVLLKGKKSGNYIIMTPIEADKKWNQYMDEIIQMGKKLAKVEKYLLLSGDKDIEVSPQSNNLVFQVGEKEVTMAYRYTDKGIELYEAIDVDGIKGQIFDLQAEGDKEFLVDATTGAKLLIASYKPLPNINEIFANNLWYFAYSKLSPMTQRYWDEAMKQGFAPNNIVMNQIAFGKLNEEIQGMIYNAKVGDESPAVGGMLYDIKLVGKDKVEVVFTRGVVGTGKAFYQDYKFGFIMFPVSSSMDEINTFVITTDDPEEPTWVRLENIKDDRFYFTLSLEPINDPYNS